MKIFRSGSYESLYDMPLGIQWYITMHCNYRCSYCVNRKLYRDDFPFSTLEELRAAVDNIASLNRPWYDVFFVGGEPTIHPHLTDVIFMLHETLKERLDNVTIITNGSRNKTFYTKIAQIAKVANISLLISIHTEYVNMSHILELIELLSRDVDLRFALMFNPAKREEVRLIFDILFEYRKMFPFHLNIDMIFLLGGSFDPRYTQEDFNWREAATAKFRDLEDAVASKIPNIDKSKHSHRYFYDVEQDNERKVIEDNDTASIHQNGLCEFAEMYCLANTSVLNIQEDGLCNGMVCNFDPILCNIYEENVFAQPDVLDAMFHAVKCPSKICSCIVNNRIPKFSSYEETVRFIGIFREKQLTLLKQAR